MKQALPTIFIWWSSFFVIGIIFLPITKRFFSLFLDKGYIFSKLLGVIFLSYSIFVLGEIHILPFQQYSLIGILFVYFLINLFLLKKDDLFDLKKSLPLIIIEEILFFLALTGWSLVRGFQPNIDGLEKFMDFGFLNSILRSTYFPPKDMWMTPLYINYYYFGHLTTAVLTKLSLLPSYLTFNLMLATIFAFTVTGGFSLGGNLFILFQNAKKHMKAFLLAGVISAWLLAFAGNLHTLYTFFTPYQNDNPVPPWQLIFSPQSFPNSYWYPNATRFIYHTIHEFPIYSFVVADLHGHVLDIPFVLLTIATLLVIFLKPLEVSNWKLKIRNTVILGGLCAIMYMTNAWDGLIYLGISSVIILYKIYETKHFSWMQGLTQIGYVFISFLIISLPFSLFFKPFASQVGLNCPPDFLLKIGHMGPLVFEQGYCQYSPWWQLAILYGFFFFWFVAFTIFQFVKKEKINPVDIFTQILSIFAFLLILTPEFVYLKDIYTTYFRANTMFKLCYQAFIILSLTSGYAIVRIFSSVSLKNKIKIPFLFVFSTLSGIILTLVSIYPYFAINSYYNNLQKFQGLDGITYMHDANKSDLDAINWINEHIKGQPVMLEAQGDSYTDYERISSYTGLPTILGWTVHEWLWRGTYDVVPQRVEDIKTIYETSDLSLTRTLFKKYNVTYVYVGDMEKKKYNVNEDKFQQLGKIIYKNGTTTIYQINS